VTALHATCLLVVAVCGTATALTRRPLRQAFVSSVFGLSLAILFLAFGAPDVALSALTVATIAVPVMVVLTLAKLGREEDER
jgi:uncharacterized MnhB-related membrane protein